SEKAKDEIRRMVLESNVFTNELWDFGEVDAHPKLHTSIILTSDKPVVQKRRRINPNLAKKINVQLEHYMDKGVLRRSAPPHSHVCNMVIVDEGKDLPRICFDFTDLNNITVRNAYPLPRIEEIIEILGGSRYFTTLDLYSGYWQVE